MPVSVVVGGQYGSEGKGKVALELVRADAAVDAIVRVGGPNSGHTGIRKDGKVFALRQIPAAAVDGDKMVILPAGSYIDVAVLQAEIQQLGLDNDQVKISPLAHVITQEHKQWEVKAGLQSTIGSTSSGTGAAVISRVARQTSHFPCKAVKAEDVPALERFIIDDLTDVMRGILDRRKRIVIEGSQGFGLSLFHAAVWPKATSRDTTAAGFLSEAGLSPFDVDDITMVIRCHPIRVAGDSGPLRSETSWAKIAKEAGIHGDLTEFTTVTKNPRRVGRFDPEIVKGALAVNRPTRIVLNHLDYVDPAVGEGHPSARAEAFVRSVEDSINQQVDWLGTGPSTVIEREQLCRAS